MSQLLNVLLSPPAVGPAGRARQRCPQCRGQPPPLLPSVPPPTGADAQASWGTGSGDDGTSLLSGPFPNSFRFGVPVSPLQPSVTLPDVWAAG